MNTAEIAKRDLSEISTCWTELNVAISPEVAAERARQACERVLGRYQEAILRYVRAALPDQYAAEEVFQDFCVRFVKGDFRHANPDRGRFRDYLKSALFRLVKDYHREAARQFTSLTPQMGEPSVDASPSAEEDEKFLSYWRDQLFQRVAVKLKEEERRTQRPLASIMQLSVEHQDWHYRDFAEHFSALQGRRVSEDSMRRVMMEARRYFRECLVREVYKTLQNPTRTAVEEELIDLGLYRVCRDFFHRGEALIEIPSLQSR